MNSPSGSIFRTISRSARNGEIKAVSAILPDTESGLEKWLELNSTYSAEWPNITRKKDSPADADEHKGEEGKFDKYFSADPGAGD